MCKKLFKITEIFANFVFWKVREFFMRSKNKHAFIGRFYFLLFAWYYNLKHYIIFNSDITYFLHSALSLFFLFINKNN